MGSQFNETGQVILIANSESGGDGGIVPTDRITFSFFEENGSRRPRLVAICAEPGLGRRDVIGEVLNDAARQGAKVIRRDHAGSTPEAASRSITRLAKRLERDGGDVVVGIDELPPSDEACVHRQARALRRIRDAGCSVIFSINPEARQLVEALPECLVISGSALVQSYFHAAVGDVRTRDELRLTRGIAALSRSLHRDLRPDGAGDVPLAYYDALGSLMSQSLRPMLTDEERRLRLALLLLGAGEVIELGPILGAVHDDVLSILRQSAPLFGVSSNLTAFSALSGVTPIALPLTLRYVSDVCALYPDVTLGCFRALAGRGDVLRASALARLPECGDDLSPVADHAAEFLDAGEVRLVQRAAAGAHDPLDQLTSLAAIAEALDTRGARGVLSDGAGAERLDGALALFADARRLLWGLPPSAACDLRSGDALVRRLSVHRNACSLMMRGAFSVALSLLVGVPSEDCGPCVSNALLAIDAEVARLMSGGAPASGGGAGEEACEFLAKHPLAGLSGYSALLYIVSALLAPDGEDDDDLGRLASRYERSSDTLVQVIALIAGAVYDLRCGQAVNAQVRASLAMTRSARLEADYLNRVALLVSDVARSASGEQVEARAFPVHRDDLDEVRALVWEVLQREEEPLQLSPLREEPPRDALWLLRALCQGMGGISSSILERMPQRWRKAAFAEGSVSVRRKVTRRRERAVPSHSERGDCPVALTLLGGFSLTVRGQRIPDWKLERRNTKSMLEYLVLRGGNAKRFQIVEQVWADCDYVQGFNRAYQTTSALRSLVSEIDSKVDLIVASRTSGEITVDMGIVGCDVDEFRATAREAVDSEDDERSLECARAAERIYKGDLYVPGCDSTGYISATRAELKSLYADAMVEGSEAALRLGHERTAARLANNALVADDMRRDAVTTLVRALNACGREAEARRQCHAFEARVARLSNGRGDDEG